MRQHESAPDGQSVVFVSGRRVIPTSWPIMTTRTSRATHEKVWRRPWRLGQSSSKLCACWQPTVNKLLCLGMFKETYSLNLTDNTVVLFRSPTGLLPAWIHTFSHCAFWFGFLAQIPTDQVDVVIGADGANSRVAKDIEAGDYEYAIAFQEIPAISCQCWWWGSKGGWKTWSRLSPIQKLENK